MNSDDNNDNNNTNSFYTKLSIKLLTIFSFVLSEKEKRVSTNPTRVLNPKVNMAVQFNVACEAEGHKITDIRVQISNKTIDCEREPKVCGGENLGTNLQILFTIVLL